MKRKIMMLTVLMSLVCCGVANAEVGVDDDPSKPQTTTPMEKALQAEGSKADYVTRYQLSSAS
jgi:hypothetical protein